MEVRSGCLAMIAAVVFLLLVFPAEFLESQYENCRNEGEVINVKSVEAMKCFNCKCINGFVQCFKNPCPEEEGCFALQEKSPSMEDNNCCVKCKDCMYKGVLRKSGSRWMNPNDPCEEISCKSNVISIIRHQCYVPCQNPLPPKPGTCCPRCPDCQITGREVTSEIVSLFDDPCLTCHCEKSTDGRSLVCLKKACPHLWCPTNKTYIPPGECCPTCTKSLIRNKKSLSTLSSNSVCLIGQRVLSHGENFELDQCTQCTCTNETVECKREACPPLNCPVEMQKFPLHNQCCPECPDAFVKESSCEQNGTIYKNGDNWKVDDCKTCSCVNGKVQCSRDICPPLPIPCPHNTKPTTIPGSCCPRCTLKDGVCTVYGNSNYRTYDSKAFYFPGPCKYQLTEDCIDQTFSIRVTNDAKNTLMGAWTKTINLRFGNLKVNLGTSRRIKVNGQRVTIPYQKNNELIISNMNNTVLVKTKIGLSIVWDGYGFLEVTVPVKYKGKLCGLCGNFNMDPRDDLTTKSGLRVSKAQLFGSSWRVGGMHTCSRRLPARLTNSISKYSQKNLLAKKSYCNTFYNQELTPCHKTLNFLNYYLSCLTDMCECPAGKKCFCASTIAYIQQCHRLGLSLDTSNVLSNCTSY